MTIVTNKNSKIVRKIYLNKEIDEAALQTIIEKINQINDHDDEQEEKLLNYVRKPIQLHINSYGGSVYDGLGIISAMNSSKTEVHTYIHGYAMSMGLLIAVCGHKRFGSRLSSYMYHQIRQFMGYKTISHIKESVEEMERLQEIYDTLLVSATGLKLEQLKNVKDKKSDWSIGAKEAKDYGIIDEWI